MRVAARQEYELNYTAESNYRTLMAIYEQALGKNPRALRDASFENAHLAISSFNHL
jgi:hypothetical protein